MSTWKTRLFGDNLMNFWGWIVVGPMTLALSLIFVLMAMTKGGATSTDLLLLAIYFVLVGHFCLALTNYCARVSEKLDGKAR